MTRLKRSGNDEQENPKKGAPGGFKKALGAPAKITADNLLRAIRHVSDKGGSARVKDLVEMFGGAKRREILSRSLGFAAELGFLSKKGTTYNIANEGKSFLAANDPDKKEALAARLISFGPYHDVLVRLRDEEGHSLKKETITEMWSSIAGGGGRKVRSLMTQTFASLAKYAGLIEDSGQTCILQQPAMALLEGLPLPPVAVKPGTAEGKIPPRIPGAPAPVAEFSCPRCTGTDIGILDEEPVQYFKSDGESIVFVKYKLFCRNCKESFSRHGQQTVPGSLSETGD